VRQEINLYQPMFRRQRPLFSARAMLRAAAVAVLGFVALYGWGQWQLRALEGDVARLTAQRAAAAAQIVDLRSRVPARRKSELLQAEVDRSERELAGKRELAGALARGDLGDEQGFSRYLEGLARQGIAGLWLTELAIEAGGREIRLAGRALSPHRVPLLVQRLSAEPSFRGRQFNSLTIERGAADDATVGFSLRTAGREEVADAQ